MVIEMKINFKKLFIIIVITFLIGNLFSFLTFNSNFKELNKPFEIPGIIFPIVWSILYLLMSISLYIITEENFYKKEKAYIIYFLQLIINSIWTLLFFGLKLYLFSTVWIGILIIAVITMIVIFYKINKISAIIQIPYLLWIIFALYLNYMIYYLN